MSQQQTPPSTPRLRTIPLPVVPETYYGPPHAYPPNVPPRAAPPYVPATHVWPADDQPPPQYSRPGHWSTSASVPNVTLPLFPGENALNLYQAYPGSGQAHHHHQNQQPYNAPTHPAHAPYYSSYNDPPPSTRRSNRYGYEEAPRYPVAPMDMSQGYPAAAYEANHRPHGQQEQEEPGRSRHSRRRRRHDDNDDDEEDNRERRRRRSRSRWR